jgi:hypothetical protein
LRKGQHEVHPPVGSRQVRVIDETRQGPPRLLDCRDPEHGRQGILDAPQPSATTPSAINQLICRHANCCKLTEQLSDWAKQRGRTNDGINQSLGIGGHGLPTTRIDRNVSAGGEATRDKTDVLQRIDSLAEKV